MGEIGPDNWSGFVFSVTQVRTSRTMQLQRVFFLWKRVVQSEAADMNIPQLQTSISETGIYQIQTKERETRIIIIIMTVK